MSASEFRHGRRRLVASCAAALLGACNAPNESGLFSSGAAGTAAGGSGAGAGGSDPSRSGSGGTGSVDSGAPTSSGGGASVSGSGGGAGTATGGGVAVGGTANTPSPGDRGTDGLDSGIDIAADASPEAAASQCSGALVLGVCWHLGAEGATCSATCGALGGYDAAATGLIGSESQGGSLAQCAAILAGLGLSDGELVQDGSRATVDGLGVGCHLFGPAQEGWWLNSPDFSPGDSLAEARIACGCNN